VVRLPADVVVVPGPLGGTVHPVVRSPADGTVHPVVPVPASAVPALAVPVAVTTIAAPAATAILSRRAEVSGMPEPLLCLPMFTHYAD
jgi:hypothetical protein